MRRLRSPVAVGAFCISVSTPGGAIDDEAAACAKESGVVVVPPTELELRVSGWFVCCIMKMQVACRYDAGRSAQGKTTLRFVARMRGSAVRDGPRTGRFSERPLSAWVTNLSRYLVCRQLTITQDRPIFTEAESRPVRVFGGCEHPRLVAYCARAHGPGLDAPALCCSMMQSTWRNLIKTRRCALPSTCRIRMLLSH